jgi:hypothetical protein
VCCRRTLTSSCHIGIADNRRASHHSSSIGTAGSLVGSRRKCWGSVAWPGLGPPSSDWDDLVESKIYSQDRTWGKDGFLFSISRDPTAKNCILHRLQNQHTSHPILVASRPDSSLRPSESERPSRIWQSSPLATASGCVLVAHRTLLHLRTVGE